MGSDFFLVREISYVLMPVVPDPFKELLRFNAFDPILSGCIDIRQDKDIRIVKSRQKILEQGLSSSIPMGLEDHHNPPRPTRSCGPECGLDFDRMVTVIIH